jgi:O-methyltransferase involved in polyketide biosynthesis
MSVSPTETGLSKLRTRIVGYVERYFTRKAVIDMDAKIAETLYIPLFARAKESKRNKPVIMDDKAVEIMTRVDVGDMIINGGQISTHGILARTVVIDDEVRQVLANKPDAVIINIGAGLDTRLCRVDNGKVVWYDLDLPDVIALRKNFIAENERVQFIGKSVLDETWVQDIGDIGGQNFIIIAEGLLMYFERDDVRWIFELLSAHFSGAFMYFDVVHSYFVGKGISSSFRWGLDAAEDIIAVSPNVRLIRSWSTGDLLKNRQPFFLRIMNFNPSTRNRSQILCVQL